MISVIEEYLLILVMMLLMALPQIKKKHAPFWKFFVNLLIYYISIQLKGLNRFQIKSFVISAFQLKSFKVSLLWKTFNQNCLKRKFATQPAGNNIVKMQNSAKSVEYFSQPFFIEMHFLITYHEF